MKKATSDGIFQPQYHGREHLNLKVLSEKLARRDENLIVNLENRSYTSIIDSGYSTITNASAFSFWNINENKNLIEIAEDGINRFADIYEYFPMHFNSPGSGESQIMQTCLSEKGIKYIDAPLIKTEHLGFGEYKKQFYYTEKNSHIQYFMVRNCIFDPTENRGYDPIN
jgi:hypothetical protein